MAFESINSVPDLTTGAVGIGETLGQMWNDGKEFLLGEETEGKYKIRDPELISFPDGANYETDNHSWIQIVGSTHAKNARRSTDSRVDEMEGQTTDQTTHSLALPFPQNIVLAENYEWGGDEIGFASQLSGNSSVESIGESAGSAVWSQIKKKSSEFTGVNLSGLAALKNQRISNPRMAALFKAVQFRQFALAFDFAPKSENEVKSVIAAIRAVRANAAPSMGENQDYIMFPNRFNVKIQSGDHVLINHGLCVATGVNVNYTPDGIWATFRSGFPVHVTMEVSFMETEIVTRERIMGGER